MRIDSSLPPKRRPLTAQEERDDVFVNPYVRTARRITTGIHCFFCTPWPWIAIRSLSAMEYDDGNNNANIYHDFTMESTFWEHCEGLSRSSRMVFILLLVLMACVMMIATFLLGNSNNNSAIGWVVVVTVQAALLLYFIYWRRHRLNLSLNRVVHGFGMGVGLSLSLVFAKTILCSLPKWLSGVILENTNNKSDTTTTSVVWLLQLLSTNDPLWIYVRAFVLVGALEEYLKYKGFDIIRSANVSRQPPNLEDCEALLGSPSSGGGAPTVTSSGAAITCAMIAVGTGFGWLANCAAVLQVNQEEAPWISVGMKLVIPIHSLLAAIQSIGVCSRDLEHNSRALMLAPAILLHGLFEYFLLQLIARQTVERTGWELTASLTTALFGIAYYGYFAGRQRKRLQELEQNLEFLSQDATSIGNSLHVASTAEEFVTNEFA